MYLRCGVVEVGGVGNGGGNGGERWGTVGNGGERWGTVGNGGERWGTVGNGGWSKQAKGLKCIKHSSLTGIPSDDKARTSIGGKTKQDKHYSLLKFK